MSRHAAKEVKLDALGASMEETLKAMLTEVKKVQPADTPPEQRITMLDKLRVIDRVLKWQAIKLKAEDDEGGFFQGLGDDDEGDDPPPPKRVPKGQGNGFSALGGGKS